MPRGRPPKGPHLFLRRFSDSRPAVWEIRDGSTYRRTGFGIGEERAAEGALTSYLASKHKSTVGAHDPKVVLVSDILDYYAEQKAPPEGAPKRAQKQYNDLLLLLDRLIEWWGNRPLSDVRASTCKDYARERTGQTNRRATKGGGKPISTGTARRELAFLSAAIGVYHAEYVLDAVPVVTLPDQAPRRNRWLRRTEVAEALLSTMGWRKGGDGRMRRIPPDLHGSRALIRRRRRHVSRFIIIGCYTGTRHDAMVHARWVPSVNEPWVDVERGLFHRRGSEERDTSKRRPPVRLPPRLLFHMRRWHRHDMARGITHVVWMDAGREARRGQPAEIIARPLGGKIRTAWEGMREDAGLGPEVTPHILRHTSATWVMQGGMPLSDAADYLGMTEEVLRAHYYHFHPDFQAEVGDAFENSKRRAR